LIATGGAQMTEPFTSTTVLLELACDHRCCCSGNLVDLVYYSP
jgi:hypothetical protein